VSNANRLRLWKASQEDASWAYWSIWQVWDSSHW